jgi:hypothetical protein
MTKHSVTDNGDLRKYFTAIPNIVFQLGLNPYELALYSHLKQAAGDDGGVCWKSRATIAKEAGMSPGMVTKARQALEVKRKELGGKPLIVVCEEPSKSGGHPTCRITITDIWALNMSKFSMSPHDVDPKAPSPHDEQRHTATLATSHKRLKEKPIKKNPEELPAHSRLMAFHHSNLTGEIPDAGAQGKAVQWLLKQFTPEQCEAEYEKLRCEEWRTTPVTWLTVKKHIGADLARATNGNGQSPSGEKILTDYGDWYTVEGGDGTPSKRYRTPEAFARETGRDLEEVKARWN